MSAVPDQPSIFVDEEEEHDSTLGDEVASSTKSLASDIAYHEYENGRRYHAFSSGRYFYPNDESEVLREKFKHYVTRLLLNDRLQSTNFLSPPVKVLDLGTGTGIWAMEFADDHPESQVVGVDLSPIQPNWVPSNLQYEIDDIEDEWTFRDDNFDFIHIRYMASAIRNWPQLLQRCKRSLQPGGKIELADMDLLYTSDDGTVSESNQLVHFLDKISSTAALVGLNLRVAPKFEDLLREAGFKNIDLEVRKLPMGTWAKDNRLKIAGRYHRAQFLEGSSGIAMGMFTRLLKWSPEQVEAYVAMTRNSILDRQVHGYWKCYFVTADVASVES